MPTPTDPRREYPSTYVVQDRSNEEELTRLQIQDQMTTAGMGGVLPEQPNPTIFKRVLDVGCGTGGWLIEAARTYPSMSRLVGVDISKRMIEYAQAQAEAQRISGQVAFHVMDALLILEFPANSFDLVNERSGLSYLRTWDWPKLLSEFGRVTRPGGVIRITESAMVPQSSSPALSRLFELLLDALYHAGHFFTPESRGVISELATLLHQHQFQNVQTQTHQIDYRAGTAQGQRFAEDMRLGFRTALPFLRKWGQVPKDYDAIYQQALSEMQQPDFVVTWELLTAWGTNPRKKEKTASMEG